MVVLSSTGYAKRESSKLAANFSSTSDKLFVARMRSQRIPYWCSFSAFLLKATEYQETFRFRLRPDRIHQPSYRSLPCQLDNRVAINLSIEIGTNSIAFLPLRIASSFRPSPAYAFPNDEYTAA